MIVTLTRADRRATGHLATVRYDNAARGNSFDDASLDELATALESAASDPGCAVIRLDMAGPHFCGGWNTASFTDLSGATPDAVAARLRDSDATLDRIRRLPVPIVAAVRGQVIGFGAGLLSTVHLPVAGAGARLSLPEARFGFAPAGVGHTIARALPRPHAYDLLTGAATATAAQLLAWGLVARVVADDEVDREVESLIDALVAVPAATVRAVVEVIETSRTTATADHAYAISARTIVAAGVSG